MAGINPDRLILAKKRLRNVLGRHVVATSRTLEQKISDAGPANQRIDPHVLTVARNALEATHEIRIINSNNVRWYHLAGEDHNLVAQRLVEQQAVHDETVRQQFTLRVGQAAEIAVYRALIEQQNFNFLGAYPDLNEHDDSTLYTKEEPPSTVSGRRIPGSKKVDFVLIHPMAGLAGVEVKNIREWIYPDREEISELLTKCLAIDAVPVLIARRIPYVTFSVLSRCGFVIHQTYRQLYPTSATDLAARVREKTLLGYHDVTLGNKPDSRLQKFISTNLPSVIERARKTFDECKNDLQDYVDQRISYGELIAILRGDWQEEPGREDYLPPPDEC